MFNLKKCLKFSVYYQAQRYLSLNKQPFPVIVDMKDQLQIGLTQAKSKSEELMGQLDKINEFCRDGGGEKGRMVHVQKNKKMFPRKRVSELFDDGQFLELQLQVGLGMDYGDIPSASLITGIGKVNDRYAIVTANDATLKGGTFFPISVVKGRRTQEIGQLNHLPAIHVVDSGGAFLPYQSDIFADKEHGGRSFYKLAVLSVEGMPQLAIVPGSCTAGGAYMSVMCEDVAIIDKLGTIFLGGPPLVKAATGEIVSSEELGGATLHSKVSGCTDYFEHTELDGTATIRQLFDILDIDPEEHFLLPFDDPLYDSTDIDDICGVDQLDRTHIMFLISRLLDGSRFKEFKAMYGTNLVTGYGRIAGKRVGILANHGSMTNQDSLKGAQFIQTCEMRDISLIFLQNSGNSADKSHFMESITDEEQAITLKSRAALISSLSCATVDKISFNIGGCHGDEHYTMCGTSFLPNFTFCWPGAKVSHSYNHGSGDELFKRQERLKGRVGKSVFSFDLDSCWYWAAYGLYDGIIRPSDMRNILTTCLRVFAQKRRLKTQVKQYPQLRL